MKYFLILWVCSAINASCIVPPISTPETYNSHNECVSAGYAQGYNVFKSIDPNVSEEQKKELLKYLAKRPYIEVAGLVAMIASLEPVKKENGKDKTQ